MNRPTIRSTAVLLRKCFWKYRIAFGFLCLSAGILLAVILIQNEAEQRQVEDRRANAALRAEVDERAKQRAEIDAEFAEQLARLERVNKTQNEIIRALLTLRKNDPELFEGVDLPTVAEFEQQVEGNRGGSARPNKPRSQRPTRNPRPRPDTPGPTPRPPAPTPTAPIPTTPAPTPTPPAPTPIPPPVVGPVLPPTQPPTQPVPGPLVDPVVEVTCPLIGVCLPALGI